jgi:hypothetical protein
VHAATGLRPAPAPNPLPLTPTPNPKPLPYPLTLTPNPDQVHVPTGLRRLSIEDPLADKAGATAESGQQGAQGAAPAPKTSGKGSAPPGLEGFSPSKQ